MGHRLARRLVRTLGSGRPQLQGGGSFCIDGGVVAPDALNWAPQFCPQGLPPLRQVYFQVPAALPGAEVGTQETAELRASCASVCTCVSVSMWCACMHTVTCYMPNACTHYYTVHNVSVPADMLAQSIRLYAHLTHVLLHMCIHASKATGYMLMFIHMLPYCMNFSMTLYTHRHVLHPHVYTCYHTYA